MQTISLKKKVKLLKLKYAKAVLIKTLCLQTTRSENRASILQKQMSPNKSQAAYVQ